MERVMQPKFYEGPWELDIDNSDGRPSGAVISAEGSIICEIRGYLDSCGNLDNANAIVAVPLMYAALDRQIRNIEHWMETGEAAGPEESKSIYEQLVAARDAALGKVND
jgi:hypothetical protein